MDEVAEYVDTLETARRERYRRILVSQLTAFERDVVLLHSVYRRPDASGLPKIAFLIKWPPRPSNPLSKAIFLLASAAVENFEAVEG
jgi:hypothetical protein